MCREDDKKMLAATNKNKLKKPIITKNKFLNLSKKDWKEANEVSKNTRGISKITYRDLFGGK
ncbi:MULTISPECIES: hypothetical protein [Aeribacillus]|jgi:hypothetical protein|uniref:Uncharacterized protein n=1 Tax=Aeribacillus pallidus TaxID=33936 RepID=A0A223E754_9BACI|nr:hypothetical protein [Aeribacillus pallidus]ASS91021.1 hypothetical protein AP3564_13025 [Aeribacillus pallidus]MDR9794195.1 hypothetical protein [Aeribacillus pallidus]